MRTRNSYPGTAAAMAMTICLFILAGLTSSGLQIKAKAPGIGNVPNETQHRIREIYTSQIGIREKGYNAGAAVEEYLRYVQLPKGNPWCAAFVCWVLGKAGVENPRTGWSPGLFPDKKVIWRRAGKLRANIVLPTAQSKVPSTGDIFGLYFPEKKRIAHVGFVDEWDGTWMLTVEGNTNDSGSPEGDGVYRKRRLVRGVYEVVRYVKNE